MKKLIKVKCRPTAVAGSFYPNDPKQLKNLIFKQLENAPSATDYRQPVALIVPHAGLIYSGDVAAAAFKRLGNLNGQINSVVLLGPSHKVAFNGIACTSADYYLTPFGRTRLEKQDATELCQLPMVHCNDKAHQYEHSLEVQLPFLQSVLQKFKLLPLVVGNISKDDMHTVLDKIVQIRRPLINQLIIISSDLSHFLPYQQAVKKDAETINKIIHFESDINGKQACGFHPLNGFLDYANQHDFSIEKIMANNSGDTAGDKSRVVGYASFALYKAQSLYTDKQKQTLLIIARESIKHGLETGKPLATKKFITDPILQKTVSCFVTLKINDQLRGCIGSLIAYQNLLENVAQNAFNAAFNDPRFKSLTNEEFKKVDIGISILTPAVPMTFKDEADLKQKIKVGVDGIILQERKKSATFLPTVWQQLPTVDEFLSRLKLKAGLPANYWSKTIKIQRYTSESF